MTLFKIGVTGQMLFWIMWEAVRRLEEIGLKVINFVVEYKEYTVNYFSSSRC